MWDYGPKDEYDPEKYSAYRARKFEKYKEKIRMLLNGINHLSLKKGDKQKLIEQIQKQVMHFKL